MTDVSISCSPSGVSAAGTARTAPPSRTVETSSTVTVFPLTVTALVVSTVAADSLGEGVATSVEVDGWIEVAVSDGDESCGH